MKILVVAANGKLGKLVVKELLGRGQDVTASSRSENKTEAKNYIRKSIIDLTKEDVAGFDAIISTFSAVTPEDYPLFTETAQHLADLVSGTDTRIVIVGGAGSLYVDKEHTTRIVDNPDFPEMFKPFVSAAADALDSLRSRDDAKWTYVSPANDFQPEGERTGEYILAGEEFTVNEKGESGISYADFAIGLADETLNGNHIQERISFVGK